MTITMTRRTYNRTESGKGWKANPTTEETEVITEENYRNRSSRESIRFMNGFCGGRCWAEYGYSYIGYVPLQISLVNPSADEKIVESFKIEK